MNCPVCQARTRIEWLDAIKAGDVVMVRNGLVHFNAVVDRTTKTQIAIGSLKFRRVDGTLIRRKGARLSVSSFARFRLVQSAQEVL
jgi:hypothetical protein